MERRSSYHDSHNRLLTIFRRKLEYFEGILFLTTNRVTEFDEAILSRIHLKIRYDNLTRDARREIWKFFISKAGTHQGLSVIRNRDLERLESITLNSRELSVLGTVRLDSCSLFKTRSKISRPSLIRWPRSTKHTDAIRTFGEGGEVQ
jgi:SpoVK/Ycf46/Vps4 family AAA+-type ATPase